MVLTTKFRIKDKDSFPPKIPNIGQQVQLRITIQPHGVTYLSKISRIEKGTITYIEQSEIKIKEDKDFFIQLHLSCNHPSPRILRFGIDHLKWQCLWLTDTPHEVEITWGN